MKGLAGWETRGAEPTQPSWASRAPDEMWLSLEEWFSTNFRGICGKQLLQWWSRVDLLAVEDTEGAGSRAWQRAPWATLRLLRGNYKCLCGWILPGECACVRVCKLCQHCPTCLKLWVQRCFVWSFAAIKGLTGSTERKKAFFWRMDSVFQFLTRREKQERGLVFLSPAIVFCQRGVAF